MRKVRLQVAFDVGGTFTDVIIAREDGHLFTYKFLTIPSTLGCDITKCIDLALNESRHGEIAGLVHANTIASNLVLEGKGAVTGLIATRGFRDELEIRRFYNPNVAGYMWDRTPPLIPRRRRLEIDERTTAQGDVETLPDVEEVERVADRLAKQGVEAVAICLINSYANPDNEQRVAHIVRKRLPNVHVTASFEVLPEIGEYERTSTTALSAYLAPVVKRFFDALEQETKRYKRSLFVMQANGGLAPSEHLRRYPASMIESGPAAGVLGASILARQLGIQYAVAFDMGGTTAKACLIEGGIARETREMEVGGEGLLKGSGYALRMSGLDLEEIGAGGGSIAWVDEGGALRTGPSSAGAVPGPVCYGRGGEALTMTDANVLLGYMSPVALAGGTVPIDKEAALRAFESNLCPKVGLAPLDAAFGIHQVGNATMMRALRAVTTERGQDPRECTLIAFGGAGPIHAANLASDLEISRVIVPLYPGLFSALGLLLADLRFDFVLSIPSRLDRVEPGRLSMGFENLVARACTDFEKAGLDPKTASFRRLVDVHYEGQTTELTIALPDDATSASIIPTVARSFQEEHHRAYGYHRHDDPIELRNIRLRATAAGGKLHFESLSRAFMHQANTVTPRSEPRAVYFGKKLGTRKTNILSRQDLLEGDVEGPVVLEEFDTTVLVPPGWGASLDEWGNIILTQAGSAVRKV